MGLGHGADDRKPEAGTPPAVAPAAHEPLEHPAAQLRRDPGPVVLHDQHRIAVQGARRGADVGALGRVPHGVLEQVQHQPVEVVTGAGHDRVVGVDDQLVVIGHRPELGGGLGQDLAQVGGPVRLHPLGVGAREQQEVADQSAHPPGRTQRRLGRLGLFAAELLGQQLEVGEHACQRGSQLVRGVGDELALAVEHRLGLAARRIERSEHPLERARELGDLVAGLGVGDVQAGVARALDLARGEGQLDDRACCPLGGGEPRQEGEDGAADDAEQQEELHSRQRVVDV